MINNIQMTVTGSTLTITIDLSKSFGPSSSGKNTIVASTGGNIDVPGREEKIGLTVYRKSQPTQALFFRADQPYEVSYADRKGKYHKQKKITLPTI